MSACCPTCGLAAPSSTAVGLTAVQRRALQYLEWRQHGGAVPPSYVEIAHAIGLSAKSKSRVCEIISTLVARGYVRRHRYASRSIIVIGQPPLRAAA